MASRTRPDPRIALLAELADPLRLRVIDRLGHAGPATVSRLAADLGASLPQLSNHLRRLRAAGLVHGERSGRQVTYSLADPGLELLLPLLDRITGRLGGPAEPAPSGRPSRTCYEHLAGRVGVGVYDALLAGDALRERADGLVEPGPQAGPRLAALGVDAAAPRPGGRRWAFICLDATEGRPHLAGALGDAIAAALVDRGWVAREDAGRGIRLTAAGAAGLRAALGAELAPG